jgi:hypothetical protein
MELGIHTHWKRVFMFACAPYSFDVSRIIPRHECFARGISKDVAPAFYLAHRSASSIPVELGDAFPGDCGVMYLARVREIGDSLLQTDPFPDRDSRPYFPPAPSARLRLRILLAHVVHQCCKCTAIASAVLRRQS